MNVLRSIRLKFCTIECHQDIVYTRFPDGTYAAATPHHTPNYREITARVGCGDDVMAYCLSHELAHCLIEERLHDRPSRVLWGIAHDRMLTGAEAAYEEIAAQILQRWVHAGELPIIGGVDWPGLKRDALGLLAVQQPER